MLLADVFGMSPTDWSAAGTIALTVVAAVTIVLTGRAGHHAKVSAQASERAAEAARAAAAVQEAAVHVDFDITAVAIAPAQEVADGPRPIPVEGVILIECTGANLWIHGLELRSMWSEHREIGANLKCPPEDEMPARLHKGNGAAFDWPALDGPPKEGALASFTVLYSFERDSEVQRIGRKSSLEVI